MLGRVSLRVNRPILANTNPNGISRGTSGIFISLRGDTEFSSGNPRVRYHFRVDTLPTHRSSDAHDLEYRNRRASSLKSVKSFPGARSGYAAGPVIDEKVGLLEFVRALNVWETRQRSPRMRRMTLQSRRFRGSSEVSSGMVQG